MTNIYAELTSNLQIELNDLVQGLHFSNHNICRWFLSWAISNPEMYQNETMVIDLSN